RSPGGEQRHMATPAGKEGIRTDDHCACLALNKRCEGGIDIIRLAGPHDKNLHAEALCRLLNVLRLILCIGICWVDQDCDWRGARHHFMQQSEPLGAQPGRNTLTPVALPPGRLRLATRPTLTGSSPVVKTIGTVVVAALAARAEMVPPVAPTRLRPGQSVPPSARAVDQPD